MEIILIAGLIGLLPAAIATSKGGNFFVWWLYGAAIFIVALPHALLMKTNVAVVEGRQLSDGTMKKCPHCAELIRKEAKVCRFCSRDV